MIADLRHPTRVPALELLLRVLAVALTGATILGLLPVLLELASQAPAAVIAMATADLATGHWAAR